MQRGRAQAGLWEASTTGGAALGLLGRAAGKGRELLARAGPAQFLFVVSDAVVPLEVVASTSSPAHQLYLV